MSVAILSLLQRASSGARAENAAFVFTGPVTAPYAPVQTLSPETKPARGGDQ
jgi:hypothetical protein